ncbi:MAG TPA: M14 family zinc carboxypeptidase, partial [Pyrinomonadaceae bacterium]|nr:M14 family zinc carboxypeptidase [Pyrinomonadaceae bacterium]
VIVVPVLNPDGRRLAEQGLMQRKNMNDSNNPGCLNPPDAFNQIGVDLNRNHDFKWGTINGPDINPCDQVYPGTSPASEPETSTLQDLVRAHVADQRGPLDTDAAQPDTRGVLITIHSYANLVMWPWGHTSNPAPDGPGLARIGGKFAGYNGYTPQQANVLYPSSGKTDEWAYGELGIPAYVFEVGIGEGECGGFMPPYRCLDEGFEGSFWPRNLPAFLYAARVARAPYLLSQGPTPEAIAAIPSSTAGVFDLRAQLDEQRNGGQQIVAAEYYLDTPPWRGGTPTPMAAADGSFDATVETANATVGPLPAGAHTLYVRAQDAAGNWGPVRAVFSPPDSCSYSISPTAQSFAASGGAGLVNVTSQTGCGWSASTGGATWVSFASGGLGTGSGALSFTVAPNTGAAPRSTTLTVAGQTFNVTHDALQLSALSLNPATVVGGQPSTGTVTLSGPAPAGGVTVALSSSNAAVATVPASVNVPAGASTQTFTVAAEAVAATSTANISAAYAGTTRTALLTVNRAAAAPTNLTASTSNVGRIDLKWTDNANNESGFRIERCQGQTCTNYAFLTNVGPNSTTYRNSNLPANTYYRYRARAFTSAGFSVYSNVATGKTR